MRIAHACIVAHVTIIESKQTRVEVCAKNEGGVWSEVSNVGTSSMAQYSADAERTRGMK